MQVNAAGLSLIKRFEGLRKKAYRDAVGIWTIGYGHTSMAGPPAVIPNLVITDQEADEIMSRDVATFALTVATLIKVLLNDNQFSALVCFAYNVGLGNFRGSSVLASVNAGDFATVPRRLALWNKAGGRVLAGLVARRAAEGMLFAKDPRNMALFEEALPSVTDTQLDEMIETRGLIDVPVGKPLSRSSIVRATIGQYLAGAGALFTGLSDTAQRAIYKAQQWVWLVPQEKWIIFMFVFVGTACALWAINERWKKSRDDGV